MIGRIVEEPYWGTIMLLPLNIRKKTYHRFLCHLPKMKTWLQLNGMEWQTVWLISPLCKTGNILRKVYAFTSTYCKILIKKIIRMPTVVVRFETCKKAIGYGTVYYRIYKGHNRRMEFSSHLHLPTSSWDETTKTIRGEHPKACLFRAQMEADLRLLNRIITEDVTGRLTMGDMIALFKQQRTIIKWTFDL